MGPTYNNLLLNQTLFSLTYFPSLSFIPYFVSFFAIFSLSILLSLKRNSFYIKEPEGALVRTRRLRDEGNGIPATARRRRHLWWAFLSHSLCLSLSLADRSRSLLSLSWQRRRQEVVVIIFAYLFDLYHFFSLDNEVRNFMDND